MLCECLNEFDAAGAVVTGRVGYADTFGCIFKVDKALKHGVVPVTGPYWHQSLTSAIKIARNRNPKWIVVFDGDGIFEYDDLRDLFKLAEEYEDVDAVVPVQACRLGQKPLAYDWKFWEPMEYDYSTPVTKIVHGHFGLTVLRTELFNNMSEPWFQDVPAQDGSWDLKPGKLDADTFFWAKLHQIHKQNRRRVIQANQTVVGHLENMILWQCGPKVVVQPMAEFNAKGKPYGLRNPMQFEVEESGHPAEKATDPSLAAPNVENQQDQGSLDKKVRVL